MWNNADQCYYYPDFIVLFKDGSVKLVEIKGGNSASNDISKDKRAAKHSKYGKIDMWVMNNKDSSFSLKGDNND